jgi:hypothetical protein
MTVTAVTITCAEFTWDAYVNAKDEWWEGCGNCESDTGFKPWYAGIHGGVCFQCGGVGVKRLAGSEASLKTLIRKRTSGRLSKLNAAERAEERRLADAEVYAIAHPNLASDLARVRTQDTLGRNVLHDLALALMRGPLSVRQERYAISLLLERAWDEAHTKSEPVRTYVGEVGEKVTVCGEISVWHPLANERYDRSPAILVVVEGTNVSGECVSLKMITSAAWAFTAKKGDRLTITAKVKAHVESRYGKQTEVTHPKKEN